MHGYLKHSLLGQTFGLWTVLSYINLGKWQCKCSCGTLQIIESKTLLKKRTHCCKVCRYKEKIASAKISILPGDKFGKWTIVKFNDTLYKSRENTKNQNKYAWICRCECGNERSIFRCSLTDKRSIHLGCRDCVAKNKKPLHQIRHLWSSAQKSAKCRNLNFNLTKDDLWNLLIKQNFKCAITGETLTIKGKRGKKFKSADTTASLDRIDSNGHYTLDNIQWVLKSINVMKWDNPQEKFIELCYKVVNANPRPYLLKTNPT